MISAEVSVYTNNGYSMAIEQFMIGSCIVC